MEKKWRLFVNLLLLQLFFSLFLANNYLFNIYTNYRVPVVLIVIIIVIITVTSIYMVYAMLRLADRERETEKVRVRLEESGKLINTLRSKHHDFVNHLQVIMGLIQMERADEAASYIKSLSRDLIQIEKLVSLQKPEVAALIGRKLAGLGSLQARIEINTTLAELSLPPDKLVSILGNLLDNAIYETALYSAKWLNIRIDQEDDWFIFEVINPGTIPPDIQAKVFEPGFTTKGTKGSGMGLYIVKNLVSEWGGTVSCESREREGNTTFKVRLPKVPARG